jgi:hypothetical protein
VRSTDPERGEIVSPVVLQIDSKEAGPAELDEALRVLSSELLSAPDLDVEHRTEPAPPNTKGLGTLAALAVTLLTSKAAASAITVLGDFLTRHKGMTIKVKQGDTVLELSGASPKALAALLPQVATLMSANRS